MLFLCYLCVLSLGCSCQVVNTSTSHCLERLISEMTYNVLMGTLNPTHSLHVFYLLCYFAVSGNASDLLKLTSYVLMGC